LQTLCALLVASDLSLCEKILHFLLFDAVQIRELAIATLSNILYSIILSLQL
jgi:hypothetical protein